MNALEKFEDTSRQLKEGQPCPCCKGDGKFDFEKMKSIKIYGKSFREIAEIIDFAEQHGYKV